jgi:beta-N-acetylhexosaminidase
MRATRRQIMLRRIGAVVVAAAATALLAVLLLGGSDAPSRPEEVPKGVSQGSIDKAKQLSPDEQVDQVMLLGFDGSEPGGDIAAELADHQLGGVLIEPGNWNGAGPGKKLIAALAKDAGTDGRIPPVFATAQEPGEFRSLPDLPPDLSELRIGDSGTAALARSSFEDSAKALKAAGILLDLAPVADVATLDSPLGARAFSDGSGVVADMTSAALQGCQKAGVACAPGHFPGVGAENQDTDNGPATVNLDAASLAARDLIPFQVAIADKPKAPAIVISLAFYSAYDPVTPAALVPAIVTDLLRDQLQYEGVAITDDLSAGAVKATTTVPEAAVQAIAAGSDMVQISAPKDQKGVREALLDAVDSGELPKDRLASAAARVLEMKSSLGLR